MIERHWSLLSPRCTVPMVIVGLIGAVWPSLPTRWQPDVPPTPAASAPSVYPTSAAAPVLVDKCPRPDAKEFNWLPSLVDDTRTILAEYALETPPMGPAPSEDPADLGAADAHGPALILPESASPTPVPMLAPPPTMAMLEPPPSNESEPRPPVAAQEVPQTPRLLMVPPVRSQNQELIAREADIHSRRGFELASRGAYFSARAEFLAALRLIAEGLDTEQRSRFHGLALGAGLAALEEAEDFVPKGTNLEADLNLPSIISRHRTPLLQGVSLDGLTPMTALQCYFTYAQEQLGVAVDREVAGSIALYGLGKLYKTFSEQRVMAVLAARPKAMVFYQAALLVNPQNHMASNDLGVLLANAGRFEDARMALEHSVALRQESTGWHNLAVVYQNLGQIDLARRAEWLAQEARRREMASAGQVAGNAQRPVVWVDPQTFAQTSGQTVPAPQAAPQPPVHAAAAPRQPLIPIRTNVAHSPANEPNKKK